MWTSDIQYKVLTRVKAEGTKRLKTRYPDINFTTSSKSPSDPKFPTVYIKSLPGGERGQTLDGKTVNAVIASFQVEVTTSTNDTDAQNVADVVYEIMKSMAFQVMGIPVADNDEKSYRNIARYQRLVGYNDVL